MAVVLLFMDGGTLRGDLFDLKPGAPAEARGPIRHAPVCEHLPKLAARMHRALQLRSVRHTDADGIPMSYRYLLFAAACFGGAGVMAWAGFVANLGVGNPDTAKWITVFLFLGFFGGVYFLIQALPGRAGAEPPPLTLRFMPSPEVAFEFSAAEGATGGATADAVRAALASGFGFTAADDPEGGVRLLSTLGPPRWTKTDAGDVVGEKQYARLTLRPGAAPAALRPEDVLLVSTEPNLTKNACVALAVAFGPLRVRIRGDGVWLPVSPDGLFAPLAVRLMQTQRPLAPIRAGRADLNL